MMQELNQLIDALLAQGKQGQAAQLLQGLRALPDTRLAAHNLIESHRLEGRFEQMFGLDCRIAQRDDIFHFFAGHPTSNNPLRDYLADGWRTLSELMLLLESVHQPLLGVGNVLEFASGHGRFTRHLVKAVGAERVTVSDVVPDAVDFACQHFGVQGLVSQVRPDAVQWPQTYGLVFVLSLFSHLPRHSWGAWLARLWQAVEPGGLLVFSTHGVEAARRAGVQVDSSGYFLWLLANRKPLMRKITVRPSLMRPLCTVRWRSRSLMRNWPDLRPHGFGITKMPGFYKNRPHSEYANCQGRNESS